MFFIQDAAAQAAGQPQAGGGMSSIIMIVLLFGVMWFFMFRPQQKKMKEHQMLVAALKKGDEVMINGGIMGRIMDLDSFAVDLEIAKNTVIRVQRGVVVQVLPKGTLKAALGSNNTPAAANDENEKTGTDTENGGNKA